MRGLVVLLAGSLLLAACGGGSDRSVLVFAAASLTDAFGDLASAYEDEHPDVEIELNLAGSSSLREQILEGAPADVFAAADEAIMAEILAADVGAERSVVFATNQLQLAVPTGNPGDVTGLADVADEALLVGICAEVVPCGRLAAELFGRAGITPAPDTTEPDVRSLLTKIVEDELDVGVVYATDVQAAAPEVEGIEIPPDVNVVARYPIATLVQSQDAADFVAFVLSDRGSAILAEHGFGAP